jgi:hypothetical protein
MRFLCLHGIGTNNHVLEMQTGITHTLNDTREMLLLKDLAATVRYELGDTHTYEFVEGTERAPIADGR